MNGSVRNGDCKVALCLPGGGVTGAMYQIGSLAAFQHCIEGLDAHGFDLYVGASSGATVAAALAGGLSVERIYRAMLDPADSYFPLERRHILHTDFSEWRRTLKTALRAVAKGSASLVSRAARATPAALWEELDRLYDSLPAGLFSLENYDRFLQEFFERRGVPNRFQDLPQQLIVLASDLDSGQSVQFGAGAFSEVPIGRACAASMALPPFFSPVCIEGRHYIDPGAAQARIVKVAVDAGADVVVLVNPMVPVAVEAVPTGHGQRSSVRDKGNLWVASQAHRISMHELVTESVQRHRERHEAEIVVLEPEPSDAILFLYNPASFAARRKILEFGYRSTRDRVAHWLASGERGFQRAGWRAGVLDGA